MLIYPVNPKAMSSFHFPSQITFTDVQMQRLNFLRNV